MRISSIDIGSNAIRQLIVEIKPDGTWKILKKHRESIRLGTDVFEKGQIQAPTQIRLTKAFKRMAKFSKKYKTNKQLAFATSAFRDAHNKKPILSAIYKASGIKIKIISGQKEAKLIRMAVQKSIGLNDDHSLLIDIGGGSVELTHLQKNKIFFSKSYKWGMVRTITEAKKQLVTPQKIILNKIKKDKKLMPKADFLVAIGTGGNLDAMAKLKLLSLKKGPNTFITYDELKKLYNSFQKTQVKQRALKYDLRPDRLDVIGPAMFLTIQLMHIYGIKKIKIPGVGLKEGAILSLL